MTNDTLPLPNLPRLPRVLYDASGSLRRHHMMRRGALFVWLLCAICATAAVTFARPGVVRLRNGTTYEGDVTEDPKTPDVVVVTIRGIPTRIERSGIASL